MRALRVSVASQIRDNDIKTNMVADSAVTSQKIQDGSVTESDMAASVTYVKQSGAGQFAADAGGTDDYAITLTPAPGAYTTGMTVTFKANTANTGAATLNVNSLGAKTIKKNLNQDLSDNDIKSGQLVSVIYDGTNFQLLSPIANPALSQCKVGVASGNGAASQNVAHGLGVVPKLIRITALCAWGNLSAGPISAGSYNGSTTAMVCEFSVGSSGWNGSVGTSGSNIIQIDLTTSNQVRASVTFDATNIILSWSNTSNTGVNFMWEAIA